MATVASRGQPDLEWPADLLARCFGLAAQFCTQAKQFEVSAVSLARRAAISPRKAGCFRIGTLELINFSIFYAANEQGHASKYENSRKCRWSVIDASCTRVPANQFGWNHDQETGQKTAARYGGKACKYWTRDFPPVTSTIWLTPPVERKKGHDFGTAGLTK